MSLKLNPKHKAFAQLMTRQTTLATSVMTALARIDAARLRRVRGNQVDTILSRLNKLQSTKH